MFPAGRHLTTSTITVDPKVLPYLGFYPLPNAGIIGNGDTGNFVTSGVERLSENYLTLRGDHRFSDKDSLVVSYFYDKAPLTSRIAGGHAHAKFHVQANVQRGRDSHLQSGIGEYGAGWF